MIRNAMSFSGFTIEELLNATDAEEVDGLLHNKSSDELIDIHCEDVPVGKFAAYEIYLREKRYNVDFSGELLLELKEKVRATLATAIAVRNYVAKFGIPHRLVVYNAMYSVTRTACALLEHRGVPYYSLHAGPNLPHRLQRLMINRHDGFGTIRHQLEQWPRYQHVAPSASQLSFVTDHLLHMIKGRSVFSYSSGRTKKSKCIREIYEIAPEKKVLTALLSSNDERSAAETIGAYVPPQDLLFPTQSDWVRAVIDYVRGQEDLFLIVRVHPRELPNRRDSIESEHARQLMSAFEELPKNVAINWPNENLSIFDMLDQSDVFLSAWSSLGKDIPIFGRPVVVYSGQLLNYPADLNFVGEGYSDYFDAIRSAIDKPFDSSRIRLAYRWSVFEQLRSTVDIGDSFFHREYRSRNVFSRSWVAIRRRMQKEFIERRDIARRSSDLQSAHLINGIIESGNSSILELLEPEAVEQGTVEHEAIDIRNETRRLADALFPTQEAKLSSRLYASLCTAFD